MGTISDKLTYLNTTKTQLKQMISYGYPLSNETFRQYVGGVFKALINSMSDTLNTTWNNLPKITTTPSTSQSINNTIEAPMRVELGASELSQSGTPNPSYPQDIHTISGDNTIRVNTKNLFDKSREINTTFNSSIATALSNYLSTGKYATGYTSGSSSLSNNANYVTTFTPCMSGVTYTCNNTYSASANVSSVCFIDKDGNIISNSTGWTNQAYTHTATSEEKYIMVGLNMNDSGVDYRNYYQMQL